MKRLGMTGAILAGGQSRRMGFNKALIPTAEGRIIDRTVRVASEVFESAFIVVASDTGLYEGLGVPVHTDLISGAGSLGGLYTALYHCGSDYAFVTACDMPFLDADCVRQVAMMAEGADCAVPLIGGRLHPMHAAYSKRCMAEIEKMIRSGDLRIQGLFDRIQARRLTEADLPGLPIARSVENVNTRQDLERSGLDG